MPVTNGYITEAAFKAYVSPAISDSASDTQIDDAINAVSRAIDNYCQRKFWLDSNAVDRTFEPQDLYCLDLRLVPFADIGSTSGFALSTDTSGDGTFEVSWQTTDYQLTPPNAPYDGAEAHPWTGLKAIGTQTFPYLATSRMSRSDRVKITAKWGWPAVPEPVRQACLIQTQRIFNRPGAPLGVAGFSEMGSVVRLQRLDPDVAAMLEDYRKTSVLYA